MAERPTAELIAQLFGTFSETGNDLVAGVQSGRMEAIASELIHDDAEILFVIPSGGFVGEMAGPWVGPAGFIDGWREWLGAWDEFVAEPGELTELDGGRALLLSTVRGKLAGSPAVVEQPAAVLYDSEAGHFSRIEHYLDQDQARRAAGLA